MDRVVIVVAGVFAGLLILFFMGARVVNQDEIALRYRWGVVDEQPLPAGFHVLWPGHKLVEFDNTKRSIVLDAVDKDESIPGITAVTADHYSPGIVVKLEYKFDPELAIDLLRDYGRQDSEDTRKKIDDRISQEIEMVIRHVVPQFTMDRLIKNRDELRDVVLCHLSKAAVRSGCELETVTMPKRGAQTVSDLGIVIQPLTISISVPDEFRETLRKMNEIELERVRRDLLKEQEANGELEMRAAKRLSEISAERAKGVSALASAGELSIFLDKWNGSLPSSIVLAEESSKLVSSLVLRGEGPISKEP